MCSQMTGYRQSIIQIPNVVCTPHLGAVSTRKCCNPSSRANANYLNEGAVENALNMPSMTAEEAKIMHWVFSQASWEFHRAMTDEPLEAINILYDGIVSKMNLTGVMIAGIMKR